MAWLRTRKVYDAELRAFGATDPGGGLPLPADEASHPHGSHGFMGLPRLCTIDDAWEVLHTDGTTISCRLVAHKVFTNSLNRLRIRPHLSLQPGVLTPFPRRSSVADSRSQAHWVKLSLKLELEKVVDTSTCNFINARGTRTCGPFNILQFVYITSQPLTV